MGANEAATSPLAGRRVLVTRPAHQAQGLCDQLTNLGAKPIALPAIEISPLPENQAIKECFMNLDRYEVIIWISVNAVRLSLEWIDRYWPQWPVGFTALAVGRATAAELAAEGVQAHIPEQSNSESLLMLPACQKVQDKRVLIIKGEGGRQTLIEGLQDRGARVDAVDLYRRTIPDYKSGEVAAILGAPNSGGAVIDAVTVTSTDVLTNTFALLAPEVKDLVNVPLVAASERIAAAASAKGFGQVVVAEGASDEAFLEALVSLFGQANSINH